MPLSDVAIRKAKPAAKPFKMTDGRGLFLLVKPTGSKLWRWKYRITGREKLLALGADPDVSLTAARDACTDARKLLANGNDPGEVRKSVKAERIEAEAVASDTFEAVAREWMARQNVAEVTANKTRWILETFLFSEIGSRPIAEVTARELLDALRKVEESGRLESAKRAKIKAGQVFRDAMLEGETHSDPTASLRGALKSPSGKHHAAVTDPARMGELLRAIDGFTRQPVEAFPPGCHRTNPMAIFIHPPMVGHMGHDHNLLMPLVCFRRCHRSVLMKIIHQGEIEMMNITRTALASIVTGFAILAFSPTSHAADMDAAKALARTNNCFKCHAITRDKDGPGWKKVAEKYKGNAGAEAKLIHHLTSGEMVTLADGSKVHHEIIKTDPANDTAQIKNLVDWILSL